MLKSAFISLLFCFGGLMLQAQSAKMNRKVTLNYRNVQLGDVLADISSTYDIYFAYSNDFIPLEQRVNLRVRKKPLSEVLDQLFEDLPVDYTSIGNQIVLKRSETVGQINKNEVPQPPNNDNYYGLGGNVENAGDFTASIEEVELLNPIDRENIPLMARPYEWSEQDNKIFYAPLLQPQFVEKEPFIKAQVSLFPSLGTNGYKSDSETNNISFNVISGRNGGVNGVEIGIMTNHVKNDVKGVQIAGLVNTVGGNIGESQFTNDNGKRMPGVQIAGLLNVADNVNAVQLAGLVNVTKGHFDGVQFAGLVNSVSDDIGSNQADNNSKYVMGVQVAGLVNTGDNVNAVQLAGLINVTKGDFFGVQIAGIGNNVSEDGKGVQVAGLYNVNKGTGQIQIATITNIAGDINGSQVSLFFNRAKEVDGVQIGFINVCDTTSGGSIGFINIVKKGYNRFEVAGNITLGAQGALKFGSYKFYNIIQAARKVSKPSWSLGYGIGTTVIMSKRTLLNFELIASHVNEENSWTNELNLLNQFRVAAEVRLGKRFSLFAGPTLNIMVSNLYDPDTDQYGSSIVPYTIYVNDKFGPNQTDVRMWIGFNGGLRF